MIEMLFRDKQNSQSGQALVEYILLIVIAIALILGLAQQIYRPFGKWMHNYMGDYLECLLDAGELPSLAGGNSNSDICPLKFEHYTLANGRPALGSSGKDKDSNKDAKDASSSSTKDRNRGSSETSSRSSGSSRKLGIGARSGADGPKSSQAENQMIEKLPESKFFKNSRSGNSSSASNKSAGSTRDAWSVPLRKNSTSEETSRIIPMKETEINGSQKESPKLVIKPPVRKVASEEDDQPWSFGQYIKFAIILLIIIAIILFLGGQIAQISKSMEK